MGGVLVEPAKAHLHQTELALDRAKRVLDFRVHAGLALLLLLHARFDSALRHLGDVTRPRRDVPSQALSIDSARGAR